LYRSYERIKRSNNKRNVSRIRKPGNKTSGTKTGSGERGGSKGGGNKRCNQVRNQRQQKPPD
jgi:hypothetical protein